VWINIYLWEWSGEGLMVDGWGRRAEILGRKCGGKNVAGSFVDLVLDFLKMECSGRRRRVEVRFFFKF
jgi:hypothetical protein